MLCVLCGSPYAETDVHCPGARCGADLGGQRLGDLPYAVQAWCEPREMDAEPGETVAVTLLLRNSGGLPDRYQPEFAPGVASRIGLDRSGAPDVLVGEERVWTVVYTVPDDTAEEFHDVEIDVVSATDSRVAAAAVFSIRVPADRLAVVAMPYRDESPADHGAGDRGSGGRRRSADRWKRVVGVGAAVGFAVILAVVAGLAMAGSDDDKKPAASTVAGPSTSSSSSASTSTAAGPEDPQATSTLTGTPSPDGTTTASATPTPTVSRTTATASGTPSTEPPKTPAAPTTGPVPGNPPPPAPQATVPDVTGLGYADAAARLKAQGFTAARAEEVSGKAAETVLRTNPGAGAVAPKGSQVTVTVAKADDTMTVVPKIRDLYVRDAQAALRAAGLTLEAKYTDPRYDEGGTYSYCRIWEFTPAEGARVKKGTVIDVTRVFGCG